MKTFSITVGALILLVAAILGYAAYANDAAERAAASFCAGTQMGSDVSLALGRAQAQGIRHRGPRVTDGKEEHDFEFQGWVFNVGVCRVGVANGKVISLLTALEGD